MSSFLPLLIVIAVFMLVAIRKIGNIRLKIWWITASGAAAMLLVNQMPLDTIITYINFNVLIFLIGIFIIGVGLEESGYLSYLSYKLFQKAKSANMLVLLIIFGMGIASTVLMNDAIAIIGTPLILIISKNNKLDPKMLIFALAFAITIGSVMSPIGNPQNLIIASNKSITSPFTVFFYYLAIPTIINLFVSYLFIRLFFRKELNKKIIIKKSYLIKDKKTAMLSKLSTILFLSLIVVYTIYEIKNASVKEYLFYFPIIAALPILIFSKRRYYIIKNIDWGTILFFISMFIMVGGIWQSGLLQILLSTKSHVINYSPLNLLVSSVLGSQLISNVPLVLIYTKILSQTGAGALQLMALAAGSTIAGNMLILGAASNIIILNIAEKKGKLITFLEFARIGIPLAIINIFIYLVFFYI